MTSPPPLGALLAGARYQIRFFWSQALPMLYERHVSKVVLEHRGVDAVDDVVVYYHPPGTNDRGSSVDVDFFQLKYHVAQTGSVSHDRLTDPDWTGTKESLLARFAQAWASTRATQPNARLSLVTNWPWDPSCPLSKVLRDGGRLGAAFFDAKPTTALGKVRAAWHKASGLTESEFHEFAKRLRLSSSAVSKEKAEEWLRDRCQLAGLVPIDPAQDHSPYDDMGARFIEDGRTEHTPESLRALLEKQKLVARPEAYRSTLAIRSFTWFAHRPEADGAILVDLSDLFDNRRALSDEVWTREIPRRLEAALPGLSNLEQPIQLALDAHLSICWYAGRLLDTKAGFALALRQRVLGKGAALWDITSPLAGPAGWSFSTVPIGDGNELAAVVSVTHPALEDARRTIATSLPAVGVIEHAEVPTGPQSVRDGQHARSLATELTAHLHSRMRELGATRLHLFPACPAALAFLLGQSSALLGPTTVYEFPFGNPGGMYHPGMRT